jgi:hypothetical protein
MKTFCFDIDGVICQTQNNNYKSSKPNKKIINLINKLYLKNRIIIFTARYMGRSDGRVNLAKKKGLKFTKNQLKSWGLNYHKLIMGKPSYDIFVDDKNLEFTSNWHIKLKKKFETDF